MNRRLLQTWLLSCGLAVQIAAQPGCSAPCGEGTVEEDGECVAAWARHVCGKGTTAQPDGTCLPSAPPRTCGKDTVELAGLCIPDSATVGPCSTGTVMRAGKCVDAELQYVGLPFPKGTKVTLTQGFMDHFTHNGSSRYAVDFPVPVGSTLVAARGGTVMRLKQDSNKGCGDASCAGDANVIYIDHGDGTQGVYGHLQYQGAKVQVGQAVCKGQEIGLSGNTGYSTGPHLHFEVRSVLWESLPLVFDELTASAGVPFVGPTYVSKNSLDACAAKPAFSTCQADLFKHDGIMLDDGVPCAVAKLDQAYTVSGKVLDPTLEVLLAVYHPAGDKWVEVCVKPKADGTFQTKLTWTSSAFSTYSAFFVLAASSGCKAFATPDACVWIYFH